MSSTPNNPHQSWGKRLLAFLLWSLFAAIFGLCGWFFMLKPVTTALGNWSLARDYQSVQGDVVPRTGQDEGGTFTWYSVRYAVGGKTYDTSRLSVLDDEAIDEPFNATVFKRLEQAKAAGQTVEVWVSPRLPDVALLSRDLPVSRLWPKALTGASFAIFALAGFAGMLGAFARFAWYGRLVEAAPMWGFAGAWCGFIFPVMMLVLSDSSIEWVPALFVGLFALVGVLVMWAAINITLGRATGVVLQPGRRLKAGALATSYGQGKQKAVNSPVKRGGVGGRGDNFDKN